MMSKENIKTIMIVVLAIIAAVFIGLFIYTKENSNGGTSKDNIIYNSYDDDLIKINNSTEYKAIANILNKSTLAIYLEKNTSDKLVTKLSVTFKDSDGNEVSHEEYNLVYTNKNAVVINIPDLEDKYAGDIIVDLTTEEATYEQVDTSKLTYNVNKTEDDNKNVTLNIAWHNGTDTTIKNVYGNVVLFKNNKIVDVQTFFQENIAINADFNTTVSINSVLKNNEIVAKEYDDMQIFIVDANNE